MSALKENECFLKYKELKELRLDLEDCGSQEMTVMLRQDKSHLSKDWGWGPRLS